MASTIQFLITPVFTVHVVLGVVVKSSVSPMEYVVCVYEFSCTLLTWLTLQSVRIHVYIVFKHAHRFTWGSST